MIFHAEILANDLYSINRFFLSVQSTSFDVGSDQPPAPLKSILDRISPIGEIMPEEMETIDRANGLAESLNGDCLVIQGPPGTGKTYTASHVIVKLVASGKKIGITSNSHKAIMNLFRGIYKAAEDAAVSLHGLKVGVVTVREKVVFSTVNRRVVSSSLTCGANLINSPITMVGLLLYSLAFSYNDKTDTKTCSRRTARIMLYSNHDCLVEKN